VAGSCLHRLPSRDNLALHHAKLNLVGLLWLQVHDGSASALNDAYASGAGPLALVVFETEDGHDSVWDQRSLCLQKESAASFRVGKPE
jgi:hypothetical protein